MVGMLKMAIELTISFIILMTGSALKDILNCQVPDHGNHARI